MEKNKTSSGIDENLAGALCYLASLILSFLAGILFLLIEKENKFVRFHAIQSIGFNIAVIIAIPVLWIISTIIATIISAILTFFVPIVGFWLVPLIPIAFMIVTIALLITGIALLLLWILLIVKAYKGEMYKLPIIGNIAEKHA